MRHGRAGGRRRFLVTEGSAPGEEGEGGAGGEETHLAECLYEDYSTKCFTPLHPHVTLLTRHNSSRN